MFRVLQSSYPTILDPKHPNLRAFWTFDDIDGITVRDSSRNSWDGTLVNSPTISAGKHGNAMTSALTGSKYMSMSTSAVADLNVGAVSMWVFMSSTAPDASTRPCLSLCDTATASHMLEIGAIYIDSAYSPWVFSKYDENNVQLTSDTKITPDQWEHLVWQSNGSTLACFVNGVESSGLTLRVDDGRGNDGAWFSDVTGGPDSFSMGSLIRSSVAVFNGGHDSVRIFDRILTQDEITTLANE